MILNNCVLIGMGQSMHRDLASIPKLAYKSDLVFMCIALAARIGTTGPLCGGDGPHMRCLCVGVYIHAGRTGMTTNKGI